MSRPILVTGAGVVSCIGNDVPTFWDNLLAGRSGIRPVTSFDTTDVPCKVAGEVDLDPTDHLTPTDVRRSTRLHHLMMAAVAPVWEGVSVRPGDVVALVAGCGGGGEAALADLVDANRDAIARRGWNALDRLTMTRVLPNMAAAFVAEKLGITGPCLTITTACAASTDAIGIAAGLLRAGAVDLAIAVGAEAWLTPCVINGFCRLQAMSTRPASEATSASRPFDLDRDGMVPAEGAAALVLEREGTSLRGSEPLGIVAAASSTCDAEHVTRPRRDGAVAAQAVQRALAAAGVEVDAVDHVNVHGTSTPLNDVAETLALKRVFGARSGRIPMTANKSIIGHASGASGALETVATLQTLRTGIVPPTINLDRPDPDCDLDYTPAHAREVGVRTAVKCNFGFGGQNSALVLKRLA